MEQLELSVTFQEVLDTPAGAATNQYMRARENVLQGILASFDDVNNREQAKIALQRRSDPGIVGLRTMLRQYGEQLSSETGEFDPIWERILRVEVDNEQDE
jgi:hypothetical protein